MKQDSLVKRHIDKALDVACLFILFHGQLLHPLLLVFAFDEAGAQAEFVPEVYNVSTHGFSGGLA